MSDLRPLDSREEQVPQSNITEKQTLTPSSRLRIAKLLSSDFMVIVIDHIYRYVWICWLGVGVWGWVVGEEQRFRPLHVF